MSDSIIAIGASAGGVEALTELLANLAGEMPAPLCVVMHVPATGSSALPQILHRASQRPASHVRDGDALAPGHIHVAPPDHHLEIADGLLNLHRGPKENGFRPAIDPLFRSAAIAFGPGAVGIILSGMQDDGTAGLAAIKRCGGIAIVQQPDEALFGEMPRSALESVAIDYALPVKKIATLLPKLVTRTAKGGRNVSNHQQPPGEVGNQGPELGLAEETKSSPSRFSCPDCGGVLMETHSGEVLHFRCRVGHAFAAETLLDRQTNNFEDALWTALRALEERAELAGRLASQAAQRGHAHAARIFQTRQEEAQRHAEQIRSFLHANGFQTP